MNKLRLNLNDLRVDTFSTIPLAGEEGGTVRGHEGNSRFEPCQSYGEPCEIDYTVDCPPQTGAGTCGYSCNGTCYYSCQNTCWSCPATCDPCYPI